MNPAHAVTAAGTGYFFTPLPQPLHGSAAVGVAVVTACLGLVSKAILGGLNTARVPPNDVARFRALITARDAWPAAAAPWAAEASPAGQGEAGASSASPLAALQSAVQSVGDTLAQGVSAALRDPAEATAGRRRGLLTLSNHTSAVDDPGVLTAMVPASWLFGKVDMRYTMCASDRCFQSPWSAAALTAGQVLPVVRGAGVWQPAMDDAVRRLGRMGQWMHMFPTGTRSASSAELGRVRPGVGRLIADARPTPLVVPIWHHGMEGIMPRGAKTPLSWGHVVSIRVGAPLAFDDLFRKHRPGGVAQCNGTEQQLHADIAARVGQALAALASLGPVRPDEHGSMQALDGRLPALGQAEYPRQEPAQWPALPGSSQ